MNQYDGLTEAERLALYEQGPYSIVRLTEEDLLGLASGLANLKVRAMAHMLLAGEEELRRNAEKPRRRDRKTLLEQMG